MLSRSLMLLWVVIFATLGPVTPAAAEQTTPSLPPPTALSTAYANPTSSETATSIASQPFEAGPMDTDMQYPKEPASDAWLIALGAAFGGALFTLLGDRFLGSHLEKRALDVLLASISQEVKANKIQAEKRAEVDLSAPFEFYEPLANSAWSAICASSFFWRLIKHKSFFALTQVYARVESANHKNEIAGRLFSLTQANSGLDSSAAGEYLQKAMELITDPYRAVINAADAALDGLHSVEVLNES